MSHHTFYNVLGVDRTATKAVIDTAFAGLVDRYGNFDAVPGYVHEAYLALKSEAVRDFYNWFIDRVDDGVPIECDAQKREQLEAYCAKWGYELVPHPERPKDAFLIQRKTSAPPEIPPVSGAPDRLPRKEMNRPAPPPSSPPAQRPLSAAEKRIPMQHTTPAWPPPPLALGNRVFSWNLYNGKVLHVVETPAIVQIEVAIEGDPQTKVWRRVELARNTHRVGDSLLVIGLCDRAYRNNFLFAGVANITRGAPGLLHFFTDNWVDQCPSHQRAQFFGVRGDRAFKEVVHRYYENILFWTFAVGGATRAVCTQVANQHAKALSKSLIRKWDLEWRGYYETGQR